MRSLVLTMLALAAALAAAEKPKMTFRSADIAVESESDGEDRPSRRSQPHGAVWLADDAAVRAAHQPVAQQAVLTARPPLLMDGEDLVVSWEGVAQPHATDFLGLSCGPTTGARDLLAKASASREDATPRSVRFPQLYMMRCNYSVVYYNFQPAAGDFVAVGAVEVGMTESFDAPKHGHIALTERPDEMAVMFNSASARTPEVKFGLRSDALTQRATGGSTTYSARDMCHAPANVTGQTWFRDPGYMHKVILTQLQPGARYFYQFGSDAAGWSAVYAFKARPARGATTANFIAYADMGVDAAPSATSTAVRAFQDVTSGGFDDFLLHIGDISYARGQGFVWDQFFHLIEPLATRVPYMVSIGNHEYDYVAGGARDPSGAAGADGRMAFRPAWGNFGDDSSGECSVPMFHRWHAPATGHGIYWYAFDYGPVHVVQMSSEHDWTRGSAQHAWLARDLAAVDRAATPWVVLTAHRMMYTTQLGEDADLAVALRFRAELEELLWTYKVNAVLVGHQHSYERSCAVRAGKCTPDGVGPVHLVVGSAGAGLEQQGFSAAIGDWSVSHVNDWGYLRVAATESTMTLQFVLNRNGAVYDEVTLQPWK
ncbi:hypothetical protein PybrP1_007311 [[Pythium] brassicae (nom. inval.)]|nr:hypothetical protein PybrP1_007311 [[Pythium] brassicae (nom. inval.)]